MMDKSLIEAYEELKDIFVMYELQGHTFFRRDGRTTSALHIDYTIMRIVILSKESCGGKHYGIGIGKGIDTVKPIEFCKDIPDLCSTFVEHVDYIIKVVGK